MEEERRGEVLGMIRGRAVAWTLPGCTLNAYKPKSLAVCKLQKARRRSSPFVNLLSGVFRLGCLLWQTCNSVSLPVTENRVVSSSAMTNIV